MASLPDQRARILRRPDLRKMVPLADTTIYDLEQKGEFPRRFYLTPRCVVWDAREVEAWLESRRIASREGTAVLAPSPDVNLRRARPVRTPQALRPGRSTDQQPRPAV